jgi:hypothetical protein
LTLLGLLRQSVFDRLAGDADRNDAERLAHDPAMRAVVDRSGLDRRAASTSQMGRFETAWLTSEANPAALTDLSGIWIDRYRDTTSVAAGTMLSTCTMAGTLGCSRAGAPNRRYSGLKPCPVGGHRTIAALAAARRSIRILSGVRNGAYRSQKILEATVIWEMFV